MAMLNNLHIKNFAIAESIDAEFQPGMTVITGETGAGKSILLGAMGLTLGDRADSGSVGQYGKKAEITASFDVSDLTEVKQWLEQNDLDADDECILRRVVSKDGKSKAYINNRPAPLSNLRSLGEKLINIHGQHAHQQLLGNHYPTQLIDSFGKHQVLLDTTKEAYQAWQQKQQQLDQLLLNSKEAAARIDFLKFQHQEITAVAISSEELQSLEEEYKIQQHAETIVQQCSQAEQLIGNGSQVANSISEAINLLEDLPIKTADISESIAMIESAKIQLSEAADTTRDYHHSIDVDQQRLADLEQQLSAIYTLSKKYHTAPEALLQLKHDIETELGALDASDERIDQLETELATLKQYYDTTAQQLSEARITSAKTLADDIHHKLQLLRMTNCRVYFDLEPQKPSAKGNERIVLNVSTNPGQAPQAIAKIASGGELSRIGLAIQVAAAENNKVPAMIFDEVDSGVGGAVAEVVGNLMRELGNSAQIFCVTHLPQVAGKAHNHFQVAKESDENSVRTGLTQLNQNERIPELARMLGGIEITKETLATAQQMLAN